MKTGVIVVIVASAFAAVACTNLDGGPNRAGTTGTTGTAGATGATGTTGSPATTGGLANPSSAQDRGTMANAPGMADRTRDADNSGINERDRRDTTTPVDQGNSAAETNITAAIRKGIMGDEKLSFNGKNVKVITVGTKVTLRGPVESDQAKAAIEALATRTAGVSEVDNQLEVVKSTTSSK